MVSWRIPNWCLFFSAFPFSRNTVKPPHPNSWCSGDQESVPYLGGPWLPRIGTHPLLLLAHAGRSSCHCAIAGTLSDRETWWQERYLQQLLRISPFSDPEPQPWFNKDCKGKSTSSRHSTQAERNSEIETYWNYYKLCTDFKWLWLTAKKALPKKLDHKLEMIIPVSYLVTDSKHSLHCPVQIEI